MSDYIQLTNISKTFGKQTVLQPLTMGFEEGMIHGIIGRNGSGKTVLMKMILGILQPTTGTVILGDKRIGKDVDFPESAGAIIETIEFIPYMSAYQNLADIAAMRGNLSKTQIKEVLEMVGLGNVGRKHVSKFSMGMRQRLAIAQAVMESPKLLILDEPMNGMDEKGVEEMRRLILARKAAGTTIILSSHNIEDIRILCDQVYRIDAGVVMREVE
ncbi:ATP-binding cassette domain-containing protein [Lachnoclostridium sp. 210928-DFI.6.3]|nr:ATP-binding cassette domain-containing protein [Lachnoclostridium sp. 210928-DFI.6.3]